MTYEERALGCMIGSAYGDSLGAAVEFMSSSEIKKLYGDKGITELVPVYGRTGNITDDTQMAMATADGIINTPANERHDTEEVTRHIWQQYKKWYDTQSDFEQIRAPGNTCLSALGSGKMGTINRPLNGSAGCGAIMRAHPIGIAYADRAMAYELGASSGAITHGHSNGYVPSGFLSVLTSELMEGKDFDQALGYVGKEVQHLPDGKGLGAFNAVRKAVFAGKVSDTFKAIDNEVGGGGGWQGHDALGIGVFAVLQAADDPIEAVRISVNHGGDTDSTGAITGALVGAMYGPDAFLDTLDKQNVELEHIEYLGELAAKLATIRRTR